METLKAGDLLRITGYCFNNVPKDEIVLLLKVNKSVRSYAFDDWNYLVYNFKTKAKYMCSYSRLLKVEVISPND